MERIQKKSSERDESAKRNASGMLLANSNLAGISSSIEGSPAMTAQRKRLQSLFGGAAQLQGAEEEPFQGKFERIQRVEEEEPLQGKFETAQRVEEEEPLQGKFDAASSVQLKDAAANETGLPDNLKSGIESLSGMSMDNVKVHYNSSQPVQLNAHAVEHIPARDQVAHTAFEVKQMAKGTSSKKKSRKKKAKAQGKSVGGVKKKTLKVRNSTNAYTSGWMDKLVIPKGVDSGPQKEAQSLSYILGGTACVGGHMINDQMGGSGGYSNIIPITSSMNGLHKCVENRITKNLTAWGVTAREYKYEMAVGARKTVKTPYGVVSNWPLSFSNQYSVRDRVSKAKLSTNPGGGVAPDTAVSCIEQVQSNWQVS